MDLIFKRFPNNPIIKPIKKNQWEVLATFNPAVIRLGKGKNTKIHILYRAMSLDNVSSIGYASSVNGFDIEERLSYPIYFPKEDFEIKKVFGENSGCEDPHLTKMGNTIFMCYTASNGMGASKIALTSISVKDFLAKKWNWKKSVLMMKEGFRDTNIYIFEEKINGKYFILHQVDNEICGDYFKSIIFDKNVRKKCTRIISTRPNSWDNFKVGLCAPAVKTKYGYLLLYYGVSKKHNIYRIGAVLLDKKDPSIVLARTTDFIFEPEESYEKMGIVDNVIFPSGVTVIGDLLFIYYGCANTVISVATLKLDLILKELIKDIKK